MSRHEIERSAAWNREPRSEWFENPSPGSFDISLPDKLDRLPDRQSLTDVPLAN